MAFDEASYVEDFIKKVRGATRLPDDLMVRYAITLPASDAEIAAQVKGVRTYWNRACRGKSMTAQVARMCRADDERLRAEHGDAMLTRAWWDDRRSERQSAAKKSIAQLAAELKRRYGKLGVVPGGLVERFADQLGLTSGQAAQAMKQARVTPVNDVTLPSSEPIATFGSLLKAMSECGASSVPDLVHPGAGEFRVVARYECLADPVKRLDAVALEQQIAEADKRAVSATEDARRDALKIMRRALKDGVDLRDLALYHLVALAREPAGLSADLAVESLVAAGLDKRDAAIIAVLLSERGAAGPTGTARVSQLIETGRLREAGQVVQSLPAGSDMAAEAAKLVAAAQERLDALLAEADTAARVPDEERASALLKEAAAISEEDARERLATVPLPPPFEAHADDAGAAVRLYWRPAAGHDADTVYVVCRTESRPPARPEDGVAVHRDRGDTCTDADAPVGRPIQYGVFALSEDRPVSRPAYASCTVLPPVTGLTADVATNAITLRWTAHPAAHHVRVTHSAPGAAPQAVPVTENTCQVTGLTESEAQHFAVTAVYYGPDGAELASPPESITATPRQDAAPIPHLRVRAVDGGAACRLRVSWTPVDRCEVRIVRAEREPPGFGVRVSAEQLASIGEELTGPPIPGKQETGLEVELPAGVHRLVPFSIGGTGIVAGRATTIGAAQPVGHLRVTPFADHATVSWEWPPRTQIAEVTWERGDEADTRVVDRGQYRSEGGVRVPLGDGVTRVEVRAVIMVGATSFASAPVAEMVHRAAEVTVAYTVFSLSIGRIGGRAKTVVFHSPEGCTDVHVRLVAAPGRVMPTDSMAGVALLDAVLSLRPGEAAEYQVTVPRSIRRPYWVKCFAPGGQVRLLDPPISDLLET